MVDEKRGSNGAVQGLKELLSEGHMKKGRKKLAKKVEDNA